MSVVEEPQAEVEEICVDRGEVEEIVVVGEVHGDEVS